VPPIPLLEGKGKKVKCTVVQALRPCTGCTAHRGSRGRALSFCDHGTRRGWGVRITFRLLFTPGKEPVPTVEAAGWAPGPVWTGAENLAPLEFDPLTVHPIASRYTDYATRPTHFLKTYCNIVLQSIPRFSEWSLPLRIPHQNSICTSLVSCSCHVPQPSHSYPFDYMLIIIIVTIKEPTHY